MNYVTARFSDAICSILPVTAHFSYSICSIGFPSQTARKHSSAFLGFYLSIIFIIYIFTLLTKWHNIMKALWLLLQKLNLIVLIGYFCREHAVQY